MEYVNIVENPRRRKRRSYTAKQLRAGFGGKRYRRRSVRRHRRNPSLASLSLNPRRRRHYRAAPRRFHRRYRNPSFGLGNLKSLIDLPTAGFVAGGMIGVKLAPSLLRKVWAGAPTTGIGGYALKLGTVFVLGMATRMLTKSPQRAAQVVSGALGITLYELFNEYLAPKIGLSGLATGGYVSMDEINQVAGVSGYAPRLQPFNYGATVTEMAA